MKSHEFMNEGVVGDAWKGFKQNVAATGLLGTGRQYAAIGQQLQARRDAAATQISATARNQFFQNLKNTIQNKSTLGATDVKTATAQAMKQILDKYTLSPNDIGKINQFAGELKASGYRAGQDLDSSPNSVASKLFVIAQDVSSRAVNQQQNTSSPSRVVPNIPATRISKTKMINPKSGKQEKIYWGFDSASKRWFYSFTAGAAASGAAKFLDPKADAYHIAQLNNMYAAGKFDTI